MSAASFALIIASAFCLGHGARDDDLGLVARDDKSVIADIGQLCAAWRTGCGKLAQEAAPEESDTQSVSMSELTSFFLADETDMDAFWKELELPADEASCEQLCTQSLLHVETKMRWPLPDRHGSFCESWSGKSDPTCLSWVAASDESMEDVAASFDLATAGKKFEEKVQNGTAAEAPDVEHDIIAEEGAGAGISYNFRYDTDDLAVQVANIFNVFPSQPVDTDAEEEADEGSGSSVLESSADPVFGRLVKTARQSLWRATLRQSQGWVRSAASKIPGNLNAVRTWFGGSDRATIDAVRRVIMGMQRTLDKTKIVVGESPTCGPKSSTMAYVSVWRSGGTFVRSEMDANGRYVINVCERYWKPEFISDDASKYGTMVHESAHHHGPGDKPFKGASPYGRAQALRLATESPAAALDNADNFAWFVYYLNRCTNAPTSVSSAAPCELQLEPISSGGFKIIAKCTEKVVGATLKFTDSSGEYLQKASNYGEFEEGTWVLTRINLPERTRVVLFFETECIFWEATGIARSSARGRQSYEAKPLHVLSSGGAASPTDPDVEPTDPIDPETPTDPETPDTGGETASLPCKLALKTGVRLQGTSAPGFKVQVVCEEDVADARLSFQKPAGSSDDNFRDKTYGTVEAGSTWNLLTLQENEHQGYTFVFSANGGASISATLGGTSLPPRRRAPVPRRRAPVPPRRRAPVPRRRAPVPPRRRAPVPRRRAPVQPRRRAPSTSSSEKCDSWCSVSLKDMACETGQALYDNCGGCTFCDGTTSVTSPPRRRAPVPPRRRAPVPSGPCRASLCTAARHCLSTNSLYKYCSGCSMCN